jgi:hypothetical protein
MLSIYRNQAHLQNRHLLYPLHKASVSAKTRARLQNASINERQARQNKVAASYSLPQATT